MHGGTYDVYTVETIVLELRDDVLDELGTRGLGTHHTGEDVLRRWILGCVSSARMAIQPTYIERPAANSPHRLEVGSSLLQRLELLDKLLVVRLRLRQATIEGDASKGVDEMSEGHRVEIRRPNGGKYGVGNTVALAFRSPV